jgi:hypothetical protein
MVHGEDARARMSFHTYEGGHMFCLRTRSRAQLAADVKRLFDEAPERRR